MTERHGERADTPADRPAPTITGASPRTDLLIPEYAPEVATRGGSGD